MPSSAAGTARAPRILQLSSLRSWSPRGGRPAHRRPHSSRISGTLLFAAGFPSAIHVPRGQKFVIDSVIHVVSKNIYVHRVKKWRIVYRGCFWPRGQEIPLAHCVSSATILRRRRGSQRPHSPDATPRATETLQPHRSSELGPSLEPCIDFESRRVIIRDLWHC